MTVIGVTMVRDEADIIEQTVRHMMGQVDGLIVANNRSVDGTNDILFDLQVGNPEYPLLVMFDDEVGYMQSEKMTRLAHQAGREFDATWIVPFDADEIWYSQWGRLGDFLMAMKDADIVPANLFDHVCTALDDPDEADPLRRIQWRRDYCAPLPKVAARYSPNLVIGMGNHEAWYDNRRAVIAEQRLAIRHFPYRSVDQLCRKIANGAEAYAATDLPSNYGAHWRQWGQILDQSGPDAIAELFHKWYWREHPGVRITIEGETAGPLKWDPVYDATARL